MSVLKVKESSHTNGWILLTSCSILPYYLTKLSTHHLAIPISLKKSTRTANKSGATTTWKRSEISSSGTTTLMSNPSVMPLKRYAPGHVETRHFHPWCHLDVSLAFSSVCLTRKTKISTISSRKTWLEALVSSFIAISRQGKPKSDKKKWNTKKNNQRYAKRSWDMMPMRSISGLSCKTCRPVHLPEDEKRQASREKVPPRWQRSG